MNQEQQNVFNLITKNADPKVLTVDFAEIDQRQKKIRAEREKNETPPPPTMVDFRKEYNELRQHLFGLQQNAKTFETRTNEAAGTIHLLEQRITEALKQKKAAAEEGNLRAERTYEHQVQSLETELFDVQEDFRKNKHWSGQAARALKAFDGHGRIAELKALLDGQGQPKK